MKLSLSMRMGQWRLLRVTSGLLRLGGYCGVVLGLVITLWATEVRGQIGENGLALGRELAKFADLLQGTHRVVLNGESVYVASAVTDEGMHQVLDRFERQCKERSGGLAEQFDALAAPVQRELAKRAPGAWHDRLGIIREERSAEASIFCIERRDGHGLLDAVTRLQSFATTGDLYDIGNLRFVYVRPTEAGKTHVLTTMTEGPFNLYKVVGKDAREPAGIDPPEAPRPLDSVRIMSAELDGSMYGAFVFASTQAPADVLKFYDDELPKRAWSRVIGHTDLAVEVWQRGGVTMVVSAAPSDRDARTHVTFAQGRTTAPGG